MITDEQKLKPQEYLFVLKRLLVISVILVLIATLFPFTFSFQELGVDPVGDFDRRWMGVSYDFIANLILLIPVGFGMFGYLTYKNNSDHFIRSVLIVISVCSSLSMGIEIIQQLLPSRFSTFSDWVLNTISGGLGILLFMLFGKSTINILIKAILLLSGITIHFGIKLLILLLYIPATLYISALIKPDSSFDNWDTKCHLMFGNEFNHGRSWHGQIHRVDIYNRAILNQNITEKPIFSLNEQDLAQQSNVFEWIENNRSQRFSNLETEIITTENKWLCSIVPITSVIRKIQSTGRLNLKIDFTTHSFNQKGPARIISISQNSLERNFTVGQEGSSLIVRMRTPFTGNNGDNPELVIPNVIQANQRINLEVIFDGACLYAKINGRYSHRRLDFNSGMNLARRLFFVDAVSSAGWGIIYNTILCAVLGLMLWLVLLEIKKPIARKTILALVTLAYPLLLLLPYLTLATPKSNAMKQYAVCVFTIYFILWLLRKPQPSVVYNQKIK